MAPAPIGWLRFLVMAARPGLRSTAFDDAMADGLSRLVGPASYSQRPLSASRSNNARVCLSGAVLANCEQYPASAWNFSSRAISSSISSVPLPHLAGGHLAELRGPDICEISQGPSSTDPAAAGSLRG